MKKVVASSLLALASSTLLPAASQPASGQTQPAGGQSQPAGGQSQSAGGQSQSGSGQPANQITIKDPAEYNAYSNAIGQSSPAAKAQAIEAFLTQYPNSVVKTDMLEQLVAAYQAANDPAKTLDAAKRLLAVDPGNLRALVVVVYFEKAQAQGDQAKLDDAAAEAQKGLAASKPANMSDADYATVKAAATPIFESAIGADDVAKKDYKGAIDAYQAELKAYTNPADTQKGPGLVDTYYLGNAYVQEDPKDLVNGIWYLTRAAQFAQGQYKDQIEKAAEYWYKKYTGNMDGFDQVKTLAAANVFPPADYKPTPAPPPPSPQDLAHQAVTGTPDLTKLSLGDKEFVLFNGTTEDAGKVWDTLKDKTFAIPGKVIAATPDSVQMAVSEDNQQANKADFTINMKTPLTTPPAVGATVTLTGTFDSYTQNPPMIILKDGATEEKAPAKKAATKRAPARRR